MNSLAAPMRSESPCTVRHPKLLAERVSEPLVTTSPTRPSLSRSMDADDRAVEYGSECDELTVVIRPILLVMAAR